MSAENSAPGPMYGKTILITGGTGGIGRATALGLERDAPMVCQAAWSQVR